MVLVPLLLSLGVYGGIIEYTPEAVNQIIKTSKIAFVGSIEEKKIGFRYDGKHFSKNEIQSLYESSLKGSSFPRVAIVVEATIIVHRVIKGNVKESEEINVSWTDLEGSMCPHPETQALDGKERIWFLRNEKDYDGEFVRSMYLPIAIEHLVSIE